MPPFISTAVPRIRGFLWQLISAAFTSCARKFYHHALKNNITCKCFNPREKKTEGDGADSQVKVLHVKRIHVLEWHWFSCKHRKNWNVKRLSSSASLKWTNVKMTRDHCSLPKRMYTISDKATREKYGGPYFFLFYLPLFSLELLIN